MKDCVFCKIVANEIPSYTVYEDEVVKAFLDISQGTPGHVLVIPKQHVANIYEYDEELAAAVFQRIPMIARAVQASNPAIKGLNIVNNNGEVAYQSVFHSHFHLVPRYTSHDDFSMHFKDNSDNYSPAELTAIQESISEHIGE
ncbi:histidine triad (HIT) protein [Lentilactobacillus senioris DSM 24302 = JCM 17472]|uniref:Histidine triad (HIT) protein n=1 Tax=Lentilactobacillus senioris DSM 24302 = JCM 17472 TaxID=1423802 RepID=A0A0R2D0C7_9LACO|nr:HIT family protein [Lentilactobacillus senioris]KRM93963.1 histidine triad (HIT) protein [Lentilactobacillus senioris DSM 24302 = JCM 17472]